MLATRAKKFHQHVCVECKMPKLPVKRPSKRAQHDSYLHSRGWNPREFNSPSFITETDCHSKRLLCSMWGSNSRPQDCSWTHIIDESELWDLRSAYWANGAEKYGYMTINIIRIHSHTNNSEHLVFQFNFERIKQNALHSKFRLQKMTAI